MPNESVDKTNSIIRDALVDKGYRPRTCKDVDAMLDSIGGDNFDEDKVARMLRKIRGEEIAVDWTESADEISHALSAEERQLLVFYRTKGQEIPPEVQAKLEEMRRRAREKGGTADGK